MPLYALRQPPGDWGGDVSLLVAAAENKSRLVGVYWSPRLRRLLAVFRDPVAYEDAFEKLPPTPWRALTGWSARVAAASAAPSGAGLSSSTWS